MTAIRVIDRARQRIKKLEDARVGPLVLAESFVVHEQIAAVSITVDLIHPTCKFLGRKRPFLPSTIGEAKGNVVAQAVILEQ